MHVLETRITSFYDDQLMSAQCQQSSFHSQVCYPPHNSLFSECCDTCQQTSSIDLCDKCQNHTCSPGYQCSISPSLTPECIDTNECESDICGEGFICTNSIGNYSCIDINECVNASICEYGKKCTNYQGSYSCEDICQDKNCEAGYDCFVNGTSFYCQDINECEPSDPCPSGYKCENFAGNFSCKAIKLPSLLWFNFTRENISSSNLTFSWDFENGTFPIFSYYFEISQSPKGTQVVLPPQQNTTFTTEQGEKYAFYIYAVDKKGHSSTKSVPCIFKSGMKRSCNEEIFCNNEGKCNEETGACECSHSWTGVDCSTKAEQIGVQIDKTIPSASLSPLSPSSFSFFNISLKNIFEIDDEDNQIIETKLDLENVGYNFFYEKRNDKTVWQYFTNLSNNANITVQMIHYNENSVVNFAGKNNSIAENSFKINLNISSWPFTNPSHRLAINMAIKQHNNKDNNKDNNNNNNNNNTITDNDDTMSWLVIDTADRSLFGSFIETAIIDGRVDTIDFSWDGHSISTFKIPYFAQYAEVDPSFSVLLQDDPETQPWQKDGGIDIKIAIIVGITIAVCFIIFVLLLIFRKEIAYGIQKSMGVSRVNSVNSQSVDLDADL